MQTMTISIQNHGLQNRTHNTYRVTTFQKVIHTTVTHDPITVSHWISDINRLHRNRLNYLIVGLDVEWRRPAFHNRGYNPVAILQLCVGRLCLIFQLMYASSIPRPLIQFLSEPNYTFVGIGIKYALEKLEGDYGFGRNIAKAVELGTLAAIVYKWEDLKYAESRYLARFVLGVDARKPRGVSINGWNNRWLTDDQVLSACVDASIFFEMGIALNAWRINWRIDAYGYYYY